MTAPRGLFGATDWGNMLRLLGGTLVDINNGGRTGTTGDVLADIRARHKEEQERLLAMSRYRPPAPALQQAVIGPNTPLVPRGPQKLIA